MERIVPHTVQGESGREGIHEKTREGEEEDQQEEVGKSECAPAGRDHNRGKEGVVESVSAPAQN